MLDKAVMVRDELQAKVDAGDKSLEARLGEAKREVERVTGVLADATDLFKRADDAVKAAESAVKGGTSRGGCVCACCVLCGVPPC